MSDKEKGKVTFAANDMGVEVHNNGDGLPREVNHDTETSASGETIQDLGDSRRKEELPVDRGWSWVVCFSVFVITLLQFGYDQAIFVLFVDFQEEFQQPAFVMTLIFTISSLTSALSALVTSNILMLRFSVRQITCVSAILGSSFTLLLSLTPDIVCVLIVVGLKGCCFGVLLVSPTSMLGYYFDKRRSFATALSNTGLCAAFILFPGFTQLLRTQYGMRGALLVISAIELHVLALALLLRPPGSYRKPQKTCQSRRSSQGMTDSSSQESFPLTQSTISSAGSSGRRKETIDVDKFDKELTNHSAVGDNELDEKKKAGESIAEDQQFEVMAKRGPMAVDSNEKKPFTSQELVPFIDDAPVGENPPLNGGNTKSFDGACYDAEHGGGDLEVKVVQKADTEQSETKPRGWRKIFDTSLLMIWPFRMVMVANGLGTFASFVNIYMPTVAVKAGLTKGQSVTLLTIVGASDLVSRVILGCIADTGIVAKTKMVAICLMVISVVCHLLRLYQTYNQFLLFSVFVGLTCGCRHNLLNVILIDYVGVDKLAKGLGMCSLLNTLLLASNHPVIGALLDATGSFVVPFHYVGSVIFIACLVYLSEPIFVHFEKKRKCKIKVPSTDPQA